MRSYISVLALVSIAHAQPLPQRVSWNLTPETFVGKHVALQLTSGVRIEGHWVKVTSDSVYFEIVDTSNSRDMPKGLQTVPKTAIAKIRAGKRRVRGRIIGVAAGLYAPVLIGGAFSGNADAAQEGSVAIAGCAGMLAGYFIGRSYDRSMREFVIVD